MNYTQMSTEQLEDLEQKMPHAARCPHKLHSAAECLCERGEVLAELDRREKETETETSTR